MKAATIAVVCLIGVAAASLRSSGRLQSYLDAKVITEEKLSGGEAGWYDKAARPWVATAHAAWEKRDRESREDLERNFKGRMKLTEPLVGADRKLEEEKARKDHDYNAKTEEAKKKDEQPEREKLLRQQQYYDERNREKEGPLYKKFPPP